MKKQKIKLSKKSQKVRQPIDIACSNILTEYSMKQKPFLEIVDNLEIDLKNLFKKYPEYVYKGLYTQLGMLEDLTILYEDKK